MTKEEEEKNLPWSDIFNQTKAWAESNEENTCITIFTQKGHRNIGAHLQGSLIDYADMLGSIFENHPALLTVARKVIDIVSNNEDQES